MVNLIVGLSIRCPSKFMNVTMWKHCTFHWEFQMWQSLLLTPLSLPMLCSVLKSNKIFILYLGNLSNTNTIHPRSHLSRNQFCHLLGHKHSEWYHTSSLLVLRMTSCHYQTQASQQLIWLFYGRKKVPNSWSSFTFPYKYVYSPAGSEPPLSHLTSCTPNKYDLFW
jgi:hypothetical protein